MRYFHLSNFPVPKLKDREPTYINHLAPLVGKPDKGVWFAPDLLWVRRMNRDKQWDISAGSGSLGGFPYTLDIFEKIFSKTAAVPDPLPAAKNFGSKNVLYVYDLPVQSQFELDITKPAPNKILVVTSDTLGAFEKGFHDYLFPILNNPETFMATVSSYLSGSGFQSKRDITPSPYMISIAAAQGITNTDFMIQAAFLTKLRELGGDVDAAYESLLPDHVFGSTILLMKDKIPNFKAIFGVPPSKMLKTKSYPIPKDNAEVMKVLDPVLRCPKNAIIPFEDHLDRILSYEYGKYIQRSIEPNWGGLYYDPTLFPADPEPWVFPDRRDFAALYAKYPPLKRFPFLMWLDVASGTVWNPVSVFGTDTLNPLCLVGVTNAPPTEGPDGNIVIANRGIGTVVGTIGKTETPIPNGANIFLAGVSAADNSVFFYRTGRIEETGGRRRTRRRHRMSRKKRRVF